MYQTNYGVMNDWQNQVSVKNFNSGIIQNHDFSGYLDFSQNCSFLGKTCLIDNHMAVKDWVSVDI